MLFKTKAERNVSTNVSIKYFTCSLMQILTGKSLQLNLLQQHLVSKRLLALGATQAGQFLVDGDIFENCETYLIYHNLLFN